MKLNIGDAASLLNVSVRTLRYYDEIGLLKPSEVTEAGYRIYDGTDIARLQQILFYRELEFPLSDIGRILSAPDYDRADTLRKQKELLTLKRDRLDALIRLAEQSMKGEDTMSIQEFDNTAVETAREKYAAEAEARWGKTEAWRESAARTKAYGRGDWTHIQSEADEILKAFAAARDEAPAGQKARALVEDWQAHITKYYYDCTAPILKGLGQMYMGDARFTAYLDRFGDGTAAFISEAIEAY